MTTDQTHEHDPQGDAPIAEPLRPADVRPTAAPAVTAGPSDGVAFSQRVNGPSKLRAGVVAGAAVALAVGAVATSFAASPAPSSIPTTTSASILAPAAAVLPGIDDEAAGFDHGRFGGPGGFREITVGAISGSDVTLKTDDGWTRTIAVNNSVALTRGGQTITLADLAIGDAVRFSQTRNDDGTYTVTGIAVVVPSVSGTVSDVTASGFKVTTRDGSVWTITTDGSTTYRVGAVDGTSAAVVDGARVRVEGESSGDNGLKALGVQVAAERTIGTVTAKTSSTITIATHDGTTVTVNVDGDTKYIVNGDEAAGLADITLDMVVGVQGTTASDGSIAADAVVAGRGGLGLGKGPGGDGMRGDGMRGKGRGGFGGHSPFGDDGAVTPGASPTTGS